MRHVQDEKKRIAVENANRKQKHNPKIVKTAQRHKVKQRRAKGKGIGLGRQ